MVNCFRKHFSIFEKTLFCVQSTVDGGHQHFRKKQKQNILLKRFCLGRKLMFLQTKPLLGTKTHCIEHPWCKPATQKTMQNRARPEYPEDRMMLNR